MHSHLWHSNFILLPRICCSLHPTIHLYHRQHDVPRISRFHIIHNFIHALGAHILLFFSGRSQFTKMEWNLQIRKRKNENYLANRLLLCIHLKSYVYSTKSIHKSVEWIIYGLERYFKYHNYHFYPVCGNIVCNERVCLIQILRYFLSNIILHIFHVSNLVKLSFLNKIRSQLIRK